MLYTDPVQINFQSSDWIQILLHNGSSQNTNQSNCWKRSICSVHIFAEYVKQIPSCCCHWAVRVRISRWLINPKMPFRSYNSCVWSARVNSSRVNGNWDLCSMETQWFPFPGTIKWVCKHFLQFEFSRINSVRFLWQSCVNSLHIANPKSIY